FEPDSSDPSTLGSPVSTEGEGRREPGHPAGHAERKAGLQEFEGEAVFHVDWAQRTTSWRLPDFSTFTTFQTAVALGSLSVVKHNLEFFMAHSNRTRAQNGTPTPPFGQSEGPHHPTNNADCFFPRVRSNLRWTRRKVGLDEVVSEGVEETSFLPNADNTFHKFSYLPFVPADRDLYTCRVEHWGLEGPLTQTWGKGLPGPFPETAENVLCSLGLAIGILGIIVGTVLFFKAMRMTYRNSRGGQSGGL
uniref:Ig-like domain-containing protein n=1 Tax=Anolis carolinensis TaxID=28377 RepID=A0A803T4Q4_ANOCA